MTTIKTSHGCMHQVTYHPEVPFLKQPKIIGRKFIDGIEHYLGEGNKEFRKAEFDAMFKTVKTNIKGKEYKGVL